MRTRAIKIKNGGFSLVELMIVISIAVIISTVLIINLPGFNENTKLQITAQEVALTVREAQVYGIAVQKVAPPAPPPDFPSSYGIHIDIVNNPTQIIIFADDGDREYTGTPGDTIDSIFEVQAPIRIDDICVNELGQNPLLGGIEDCTINTVTVLFKRPDPEPTINSNGVGVGPDDVQYARVVLENSVGSTQNLYIWKSGQISVITPIQVIYVP